MRQQKRQDILDGKYSSKGASKIEIAQKNLLMQQQTLENQKQAKLIDELAKKEKIKEKLSRQAEF